MLSTRKYLTLDDFRKNIYFYLIALLIICIGAGAGISYYSKLDTSVQNQLSQTIIWVVQNARLNEFDYVSMLLSSLLGSALLFSVFYICSLHILMTPVLIIGNFIKGFTLGFMISSIVGVGNFMTSLILLLAMLVPKGLMVLLTIKSSTVSFNSAKTLLIHRKSITSFNSRLIFIRNYHFVLLKCLAGAVFCSLFEVGISTLLFKIA